MTYGNLATLGDNIRKLRKIKGFTQAQLAEKIGSTSGTLSHIEKGSRKPSLRMLEKIAKALNATTLDLIAGAENIYFDELNKNAFSSDSGSTHLNNNIDNTVIWGTASIKEQMGSATPIRFIQIPVLGKIPAGIPVEAKENIIDYVSVPETDINHGGNYFFLQVQGDSMVNSGIKNGYRVLVRQQSDVENGEIAIVRVNSHDATLKRVKKIDGQVILYPDNPEYDPIIVKEEGAEIIGKVIKVEFDPNKKY